MMEFVSINVPSTSSKKEIKSIRTALLEEMLKITLANKVGMFCVAMSHAKGAAHAIINIIIADDFTLSFSTLYKSLKDSSR